MVYRGDGFRGDPGAGRDPAEPRDRPGWNGRQLPVGEETGDGWFYAEPRRDQAPAGQAAPDPGQAPWDQGQTAWGPGQRPASPPAHGPDDRAAWYYRDNEVPQGPAERTDVGYAPRPGRDMPWPPPETSQQLGPGQYRGPRPTGRPGELDGPRPDRPRPGQARPATPGFPPGGTPNGNGRGAATDNGRGAAGQRRAPQETTQQRALSVRLWGVTMLAVGLGVLGVGLAVWESYKSFSLAQVLYWPAIIIPTAVFGAVLLSRNISRALRHTTIALVGLYSAAIWHMSTPLVLGGFDEHLHERTLSDLMLGGGLFAPNPLLNVSPNYPGMELLTGLLIRLTGMPTMLGITLVVLLSRYLLVQIIYLGALTINRSVRFASLVVLLYSTSPQFLFFNSQYAYQTLALPLGLGGLLLIRYAQLAPPSRRRWFTGLGILTLMATVVTHHITSWFVFVFLVVWMLGTPKASRRPLVQATIGMAVFLAVWTAAVASKMESYLGPVFAQVLQQAESILGGKSQQRSLGASSAGFVLPEWQKAVLILYAITYTACAVWCGFTLIRRSVRGRRLLAVLGVITIIYPATLAAHFVPSAASIGDRASTFLFLPLAVSVSLLVMRDPRLASRGPSRRQRYLNLSRPRTYVLFAVFISIAYMGGILLGGGPDWNLLPGSYMVIADSRSQDPETIAAVRWTNAHLAPGSRVIADRDTADLLAGEARMWPLLDPTPQYDYASIYFSPTWNSYNTKVVQQLHISYIYVDTRLSEGLPQEGYYIFVGETPNPTRLTLKELTKFSKVPGLKAVYQHGPISIYSTAGLGVKPETTGYTAVRPMGLGTVGDAIAGIAVAGLVYALRRRLRWLTSGARSAGVIGTMVAGTSAAIFVSMLLFGTRLVPGPAFTVGAVLAAAVCYVIDRVRSGRSLAPGRLRLGPVSGLAILGVLFLAIGIAIDLHASWTVDVDDVNAILRSIR
jgi:hypothetical protein